MSPVLDEILSRQIETLTDMNHLYEDLVSALKNSATKNIPHSGFNPHTRPGWTNMSNSSTIA
jgi:hypothetical protein